jgi:hypothetical protein
MTEKQKQMIEVHGRALLVIFPNSIEQDPIKLCKKLRRLEARGAAIGLRLCNGPEYPTEDAADIKTDTLLDKVNTLLGNTARPLVPVFINRDPRGYALKIQEEWVRTNKVAIRQDWGGYGLIAPEIGVNG